MQALLLASLLVAAVPAAPAPPRGATVFVDRPMVIERPGRYVVTRPIRGEETVLHILSGDVEVDLGGFVLESSSTSASVVRIAPAMIQNVRVAHGWLRGGGTCLFADRVTGLTLQDLDLAGCDRGMVLDDNKAVTVERCRLQAGKQGLAMDTCDGCRILENLVTGGFELGIGLGSGSGGEISRNQVSASTNCMSLAARTIAIRANVVTECGNGIALDTVHAVVEGNLVSNAQLGLAFTSSSSSNVYRENTSRGNVADFLDEGDGNTSGGGNFLPGPR